jgi:hypothetical protein
MNTNPPSTLVELGIPALALLVAALFIAAVIGTSRVPEGRGAPRNALLGVAAVLGIAAALAASGVLADASRRPPPMMPLFIGTLVATIATARSAIGKRIALSVPLWALVAAQGFRLPLELVMHQAAAVKLMPHEMTFGGLNYDIVTGFTALLLAPLVRAGKVSARVVLAWNIVGSLLLCIIITVAVLALPWIHAFGPDHVNSWVLQFPYIWLPTALVPAALFGHLVIFRRRGQLHRSPVIAW